MTTISVTCTKCGKSFTPDHADYVRGTWRVCPPCRTGSIQKEAAHG